VKKCLGTRSKASKQKQPVGERTHLAHDTMAWRGIQSSRMSRLGTSSAAIVAVE